MELQYLISCIASMSPVVRYVGQYIFAVIVVWYAIHQFLLAKVLQKVR